MVKIGQNRSPGHSQDHKSQRSHSPQPELPEDISGLCDAARGGHFGGSPGEEPVPKGDDAVLAAPKSPPVAGEDPNAGAAGVLPKAGVADPKVVDPNAGDEGACNTALGFTCCCADSAPLLPKGQRNTQGCPG
jgi:hypothetical protein